MKLPGYYSSGQFARMADVSIRTIRFYDKQNILKPSYVNESGARFYTDSDFARLQQILLLKYLGFSLDDIREMTIDDADYHFMLNSLKLQLKLVRDKIEQMQSVEKAIEDTATAIEARHHINWSQMLNLIHLTNMEKSLTSQYKNATNISARIRLHNLYSQNPQGWFPWLYEQCRIQPGMRILELGCGNGALWTENKPLLPQNISICLSDISEGMIRDARRTVGSEDSRFSFHTFDCHQIPFDRESFDLVIANHVLFYCKDIPKVCQEVKRVLKNNGHFLCSTYGDQHMKEINQLVQEFDNHVVLSSEKLYERFGLKNGESILNTCFPHTELLRYEDSLLVDRPEPIIEYILSCHGNQNQYLLERYKDFRTFVERKTGDALSITKDAGAFRCTNVTKIDKLKKST